MQSCNNDDKNNYNTDDWLADGDGCVVVGDGKSDANVPILVQNRIECDGRRKTYVHVLPTGGNQISDLTFVT